jgi:hypothetical protein
MTATRRRTSRTPSLPAHAWDAAPGHWNALVWLGEFFRFVIDDLRIF